MKLLMNEAKLTGFWARNWATILIGFDLKFALWSEKFPGLSRNRPLQSKNGTIPGSWCPISAQYSKYSSHVIIASLFSTQ